MKLRYNEMAEWVECGNKHSTGCKNNPGKHLSQQFFV